MRTGKNSLLMATMLFLAASVVSAQPKANAADTANTALHTLFDEYWQDQLRFYPTWGTYLGDKRYDSLLDDVSSEARLQIETAYRGYLDRLKKFDKNSLSAEDRVSVGILELKINESFDTDKFKTYTMPISQQGGPHIDFPGLLSIITFQTTLDYQNFFRRMQAFPNQIDQTIANMREGMSLGLVSSKVNIEPVVAQIESFIVSNAPKSVFFEPIQKNEGKLDFDEIEMWADSYDKAIMESVVPAYVKLKDFIVNEYLPKCRAEFGVWSFADGKERYNWLIKRHTTLALNPDDIAKTGLAELEKIHADMDAIIAKVGFKGSRTEFMDYLHKEPKFYYTTADSLIAGYDKILRDVEKRTAQLFGILPNAKCEVKEIEAYRAADAPTAYYSGAAEDGSRPGYFYANTYMLETRPKYEMEALTYHEAIPGHHLQGSIAQELEGIPEFRKNEWFTAYGEGWALYSEQLPKEMGLYTDPYSDFGRLIYDAWRAARLVVDVGLHYHKWDRQRAIDFMKENFGGTEHNIVNEVDRYIADPGQALGYKIGQLKIRELRARAEKELGAAFKITEFHDQILNSGSVPLEVLEEKINNWIAGKRTS
ncbi:MAG: DUF885 domain-containing protein [candidate division Zixibacteria bacterium]|nr:DUF885 domain-containing protein [candidate division Zixibacteria bacterium]